jgi:predicted RNA-binding protein with PUA-like domain
MEKDTMRYWLFKSEPESFSIDHLAKRPKQIEPWNGVRNYQARNMLRDQIKVGDKAFFYHSNCKPAGIVGIVDIVKNGYSDPTAFDPDSHYFDPKATVDNPRWFMVDVKFNKKFKQIISLPELKLHPLLENMQVVQRGNRLSIMPVTHSEWKIILTMAK